MHLHLDCFSGLAGDMLLGALFELGAPEDAVRTVLRTLPLEPWSLTVERRDVGHGLTATGVRVELCAEGTRDAETRAQPAVPVIHAPVIHAHGHGHDHTHTHAHPHVHTGPGSPQRLRGLVRTAGFSRYGATSEPAESPSTAPQRSVPTYRNYDAIRRMLDDASHLQSSVRDRAQRVFRRLAEAEAKVHGFAVEDVHFHEVGAVDSIVDIVGVCVALEALGVTTLSCTPLPLSSGFTRSLHGQIPLPAPATLECLALCDAPVYASGLELELVTPTGAAIVSALATEFSHFPKMRVERIGYGGGTRNLPDRPNAVRAILGQLEQKHHSEQEDTVVEISANVDDQTPQELAHVAAVCLREGALDAWLTPIVMKKGRAAHQVSLLARPLDADRLAAVLLRESSTLGVRWVEMPRRVLNRVSETVSTPLGDVRVKLGLSANGEVLNVAPECDDVARIADQSLVPFKEVRRLALIAARSARRPPAPDGSEGQQERQP